MLIPLDRILPNPEQPRKEFDKSDLQELANSIRQNSLIQPITVESAGEHYILHDGERRVRATKLAGLAEIEAHVVPPLNGNGSIERLSHALVANLQRSDLNPIEEAQAYQRLRDEFKFSVNQIAVKLGVNPVRVYQRLELLDLDPEIQELIAQDRLGADRRAMQAIKNITSKELRIGLAKKAAAGKYTIKEIISAASKASSMQCSALQSRVFSAARVGMERSRQSLDLPKWNALSQIGRVPSWDVVEESTDKTCSQCSLRSMASESTCRECPLPASIKNMIEISMSIPDSIPLRKKAR